MEINFFKSLNKFFDCSGGQPYLLVRFKNAFLLFLSDQILEVLYQLSEKNRIDGIRSRFLGLFYPLGGADDFLDRA